MECMNDGNISGGSDINRQSTGNSSNVISTHDVMSYNGVSVVDPVVTAMPSGTALGALSSNAQAFDSSTTAATSASADRSLPFQ